MISVNTFVRQSSVWGRCTPSLDATLRWINQNESYLARPVLSAASNARNALIAETAFELAREGSLDGLPSAEQRARAGVLRLPESAAAASSLTRLESQEAIALATTILAFIGETPSDFGPHVPGCGVVENATADVLRGAELIEVKSVQRPFRSTDLRQALAYAAMLYASGVTVDLLTLLNPRRGRYKSLPLESLAFASSGKAAPELLQDLVEEMVGLQVSA